MNTSDPCPECVDRLEHCHATSVEHVDGTTECLADEPCGLAHELHRWPVACPDVPGVCSCRVTAAELTEAA